MVGVAFRRWSDLSDEHEPSGDEPRRFLPDGRPIATKRKKKKTPPPTAEGSPSKPDVAPDLIEVEVAAGGRVVVASDLSLSGAPTDASLLAANELARLVDTIQGSAVLVLAGNTFDLVGEAHFDPSRALASHPRLTDAVHRFAQHENHRVIVLPGSRDSSLAWHDPARAAVARRLGAEVALAVETQVQTGEGERRVRIEPGHRFDPLTALDDPWNPGEVPLGQHAHLRLVELRRRLGPWVEGVQDLTDPSDLSSFIGSRMFYRRVLRRFSWVLLPLLAALVTFVTSIVLDQVLTEQRQGVAERVREWAAVLGLGGVALIALSAVFAVLWWWTVREPLRVLSVESVGVLHEDEPNDAARAAAGRLLGQGHAGMVTGHTAHPELADLGNGFYANTGNIGEVALRRPGRFGMPDAWVVGHQQSWVEIEAGSRLHVRLSFAVQQPPTSTFLERLLTTAPHSDLARPEVVARWPEGNDWPDRPPVGLDRRRARRIGALAIALAGIVDLVSAVLPPVGLRLAAVRDVVPLAVSQAAAMVVALLGLLLMLVARGVRRGQRHAWLAAEVALFSTFVLHVVKGLDFEEALVAVAIGLYLLANRRYFRVRSDDWSLTRGLAVLVGGAAAAIVTAALAIKVVPGHRNPDVSWLRAFQAGAERMVGATSVPVGSRLDQFLVPVLVTVSIGLVVYAGWLVFGPVVAKRLSAPDEEDAVRARHIVESAAGDTLAYFALRDDKRWYFHGETLVAYAVTQGVALVSPDPLGPVAERRSAWFAFRQFADDHGWPIAVMGASEDWLPIYRSTGMREMYVGDEAVADVRRFSLEGGRNKSLRQAVNRIANNGYRMEFHDPAHIDASLEASLRALMTESRRGEMERGFSMTLGRIFDPRDTGLLLAVCFGPDDVPAAFCQYVPAPAIEGYSLDLMRRSERPDHPNGLTDYVVVETMNHLREQGLVGLGLNFATMRGVLAGERGDNTTRRVERWFYRKMSDSMQIESLWRYNEKFDPDWVPRFACYDSAEHLLASATALAKAEAWWDIPVVGRFFRPDERGADADDLPTAGSADDLPTTGPVAHGAASQPDGSPDRDEVQPLR